VAVATQESSPELRRLLFQVVVAVFHLDQQQMEPLVAVVALIKMVVRQELRQLLVEVELTLLVVLVQLEIQVVQQQDRYLLMVHIYKAVHPVIKQIQKAAVAVVVVTTAVAVVRIKLQVVDQKTAAVVADRATLI
jgi:hypothetical protein